MATDFKQWVDQNEFEIPAFKLIKPENLAVMYMLDRICGALMDISGTLDNIEDDLNILAGCVGSAEGDADKFFVISGGVDCYEH